MKKEQYLKINKVLILTEGGEESGYGHLSRCLALSQAFNEVDGRLDVKLVVKADKSGKRFFKKNAVDFLDIDWLEDSERIKKIVKDNTIIIIDSYHAPLSIYKDLRRLKSCTCLAAIDDYNRIPYDANVIINVSVYNKDSVGYKNRDNVEYLVGKKYSILNKEYREKQNYRINKVIKNVLISFGGTDCTELIENTIQALSDYNFTVHAIGIDNSSNTFINQPEINLHSELSIKDMCFLMQNVDLCITGGGQILNELSYLGVPTLSICMANNQLNNIKRLEAAGFVNYVGWYNDGNLDIKLRKAVESYMNLEERIRRSNIGKSYSDGKGVLRIAERILEIMVNYESEK